MVEGARLESVYTAMYRGFESHPFRQKHILGHYHQRGHHDQRQKATAETEKGYEAVRRVRSWPGIIRCSDIIRKSIQCVFLCNFAAVVNDT